MTRSRATCRGQRQPQTVGDVLATARRTIHPNHPGSIVENVHAGNLQLFSLEFPNKYSTPFLDDCINPLPSALDMHVKCSVTLASVEGNYHTYHSLRPVPDGHPVANGHHGVNVAACVTIYCANEGRCTELGHEQCKLNYKVNLVRMTHKKGKNGGPRKWKTEVIGCIEELNPKMEAPEVSETSGGQEGSSS